MDDIRQGKTWMPAWTDNPAADAEAYAVYLEENKEEKYDRLSEDEFVFKNRKGNTG